MYCQPYFIAFFADHFLILAVVFLVLGCAKFVFDIFDTILYWRSQQREDNNTNHTPPSATL
jgi:hypothetical protein